MSILQICSEGFVTVDCRCPEDHGAPITTPCTETCRLTQHEVRYLGTTYERIVHELKNRVTELEDELLSIKMMLPPDVL